MKCRLCRSEQFQVLLIVGIYIFFGMLWIYLSDRLLFFAVQPQLQEDLSVVKGEVFVLLSAVLLHLLISSYAKRLKVATLASEERFGLIADAMPGFVWTASPDGTVDYVNEVFKEFTGMESYDRSSIHPDDRAATDAIWRQAMETGMQYEIEHRFRRHDGVYRWYLCRSVPVRDSTGTIVKWYGTSTDIDDLKTTKDRISRILDSTSDGFIAIDREWRVTYFNRKAEELSGLKAEQLLGRLYWEVTPQALGTSIETAYRTAMEENRSVHFEEYYDRYGRLLDVYVHPYPDGIAVFFHDLSEREQAAEALRSRTAELESLLKHAPIGFAFFDRKHRFMRVNDTLCRINGVSVEKTLGKSIAEVLPVNAQSIDPILDRVFETGAAVEAEIAGETPKEPGVIRHWLTGFYPVFAKTKEPVAAGAYVVEISERKRSEENLKEMIKALERSNRELQQFAYVASHDLQEPLRNVTRYMELFARKYRNLIDQKADTYLRFAVEGANRIHELVNDLLIYSEVGAEARELTTVAMDRVVEEAIDNLRQTIDESHANINMGPMPVIRGNRPALVQLLQNLLNNAIKFRRKGVTPRIRVTAEQTADEWRFCVHDNGMGIEAEYFEKIFVIFQRLHGRAEHPGTGIGLAICRKIVELHGGRIWVESRIDEGSSLYFTIPDRGGTDEHHRDTAGGR